MKIVQDMKCFQYLEAQHQTHYIVKKLMYINKHTYRYIETIKSHTPITTVNLEQYNL